MKLSRGGRQASQAFNHALIDDDLFDERILGGGDFVEQIQGQGPSRREVSLTLEGLITKVATHCALDVEDLAWPCRQPSIVRAKAIICYLAMRRFCLPGVEVATRLAYSSSAASRAANRGEQLFRNDEMLMRLIR